MYDRSQFIENGTYASNWEWLKSKGTSYQCYLDYIKIEKGQEEQIGETVNSIRIIIYALSRPFSFVFFYWTLLVFFLHKFNFKKPVMKILLIHIILRVSGNVIDKLGELFSLYFSVTYSDEGVMSCVNTVSSPERHPLRWVLTRQLGNFLWYLGEIVADWYPLLRTKAVVKEKHLIRWVFISCGIYNLSKIILIGIHFKVTPSQLYNEKGEYDKDRMDMFYFVYWVVQLIIIYTSALYDLFVYLVLKKSVFTNSRTDIGFFKKFKTISEYRILLSAIISALFLPIVSVTIIIKFIYYIKYNFHDLDFSFDEVRKIISNVQYYMIFIDQILLFQSKQETSYDTNVSSNSYKLSLNKSNGSRSEKFQYSTLNNSTNALLSRSTIEQSESNTNTNMIISSMDYYNNTFNTITRKEINMNNYKFGNNNNSNRTKDRNVS